QHPGGTAHPARGGRAAGRHRARREPGYRRGGAPRRAWTAGRRGRAGRRDLGLRVFNFAAGPATLPVEVHEQVREELTDWQRCGMSGMEVSYRSKAFIAEAQEAEQLLRELLAVPAHYRVLFLQGGATGEFAAIPMNIARADSTVDYLNTGAWSKKALAEARSEERRVGKECRDRWAPYQ